MVKAEDLVKISNIELIDNSDTVEKKNQFLTINLFNDTISIVKGVLFMESILLRDYLSSRVIAQGKQVDGYTKMYYQTNEDLVDPILDVDFYHKDVFSVLASSDQVFTARYLEAKTVDAFDYNRLPLHYFYLRLWSLQYKNLLYPDILDSNRWLASLLRLVKPTNDDEYRALVFFRNHLRDNTVLENLFYDIYAQPIGKTLYTKPEELKDCLSPELRFYHLDMFKEYNIKRTYDIILLSNIIEWARGDKKRLEIAKNNLHRLLNPDGVVICSNLIHQNDKQFKEEQDIFSDLFQFEDKQTAYTYTKK